MKLHNRLRCLFYRWVGFAAATIVCCGNWPPAAFAVDSEPSSLRWAKTRDGQRPRQIVAISDVCAWPKLTQLSHGTIIATIFNKPCHGTSEGDIECWASTDEGHHWQKRGTPAPHEPNSNRIHVAVGLAADGSLVVLTSGWSNEYGSGKVGPPFRSHVLKPWICRSSDEGRTWTIDKDSFPEVRVPFGSIVVGQDGTLRAAASSGGAKTISYVYRSVDDGKTWGNAVPLDSTRHRDETALFHLGGGRWLAAARQFNMGMGLYASTDDGKTWEYREEMTGSYQIPGHFCRLRDGGLLFAYGHRTANLKGVEGVDVKLSHDDGRHWSEPVRLLEFQGDGGYPCSVQLADGQILTAYYAQKTDGFGRYHMGVVVWDAGQSWKN